MMDNYYLLRQNELIKAQQESIHRHCQEEIEQLEKFRDLLIAKAKEVIKELDNYDAEDNKGLCNRIENAIEKLNNLVSELEG